MSTAGKPDVELLDLAYAYAMDSVTEWERHAIERRREGTDRLTAAEFDSTVATLHDTLAELSVVDICAPPPELEAGLLHALDRALRAAGRGAIGPRRMNLVAGRRLDRIAAAAVLLPIVLGVGIVVGMHRADGERAPSPLTEAVIAAQPDAVTRTAPITGGGTLRIETSSSLSAVAVAFDNLSAPPPGTTYQLWLIPPAGTPRSAAVLHTSPDRPLITKFAPTDTLAITVEPADGSPLPTTPPIAAIGLS